MNIDGKQLAAIMHKRQQGDAITDAELSASAKGLLPDSIWYDMRTDAERTVAQQIIAEQRAYKD